jgi:hypothetical protein
MLQLSQRGAIPALELACWMVSLALATGAAGAGATHWGNSIRWTAAAAAGWLALAIVMAVRRRCVRFGLRRNAAATCVVTASEQRVLALRDDLAGWSLMLCFAAAAAAAQARLPFASLIWIVRVVAGVMALQGARVLLRSVAAAWRDGLPMARLCFNAQAGMTATTIAITGLVLTSQTRAVLTLLSFASDQNQDGSPVARTLATLPAHLAQCGPGSVHLRCDPLPGPARELAMQTSGAWWFGRLGQPDYILVRLDLHDAGTSWRFEWR